MGGGGAGNGGSSEWVVPGGGQAPPTHGRTHQSMRLDQLIIRKMKRSLGTAQEKETQKCSDFFRYNSNICLWVGVGGWQGGGGRGAGVDMNMEAV